MAATTQIRASTPHPLAQQAPLRVVLAGGSGHLGKILQRHLAAEGHSVRVVSRQRLPESRNTIWWDGRNLGKWAEELAGTDVLINLSGRSVDCRYTAVHRQEILESRVRTTQLLGEAIRRLGTPPRLWLNASTATIYRHSLDREMDEMSGEIDGAESNVANAWKFSVEVAKRWEEAFWACDTSGIRRVALRTAMVMSPREGGAFDILLRLVRFGLGGTIGDGCQYVSWIHDADFIRVIDHLLLREHFEGTVNVASPGPISYSVFMRILRGAWGRRVAMPVPRSILEIGAFLLRTESELVLKSRRVVPRRLLDDGFAFQFPHWDDAARDLVVRWRNQHGTYGILGSADDHKK